MDYNLLGMVNLPLGAALHVALGGESIVSYLARLPDLIAYWPMDDPSGSVARALPLATFNGANTGAVINQPAPAPLLKAYTFDGSNDVLNVYTAALASAWDETTLTLLAFAKVSGAGVWTDSANRWIAQLSADSDNRIVLGKSSGANTLSCIVEYGNAGRFANKAALNPVDFFMAAVTVDTGANQAKFYYNGVQADSTMTSLGTWGGGLGLTLNNIGAETTGPAKVWDGDICHVALYNRVFTPAQVLEAAQRGGVAA